VAGTSAANDAKRSRRVPGDAGQPGTPHAWSPTGGHVRGVRRVRCTRSLASAARSTTGSQATAHLRSHPATLAGIRRQIPTSGPCLQRLKTHSKNRVGMAGFEPPASCSQISPVRTLDVAGRCPMWRQPAGMVARRSLTPLRVRAHWLPLWLLCAGYSRRRSWVPVVPQTVRP
jgi:hypothetical protein